MLTHAHGYRTDEADPAQGPADELRFDRGDLLRAQRRDDGTLLVEGYAARPGVYIYRNADGSERRELVPRSTLEAFARTLARSPVTLRHPGREDGGRVTPDNYQRLSVGDVDGEVLIEDDGFVRVKVAIRRRDAIDAVESKEIRELSPGYGVRLDTTPGTDPEFGAYDAIQVERFGNHLALVENARGGSGCHIRVDGAPPRPRESAATRNDGVAMHTILAVLARHGLVVRTDSEGAIDPTDLDSVLVARKQDHDSQLKQVNDRADEKAATLEAERDAEKARADKAEQRVTELEQAAQERADADALAGLVEVAKGLKLDTKGKDLKALRLAIAGTQIDRADGLEDKPDAYLDALIDRAKAQPAARFEGEPKPKDKRADGDEPFFKDLGSTYTNRGDA